VQELRLVQPRQALRLPLRVLPPELQHRPAWHLPKPLPPALRRVLPFERKP
jgi:hypothetical protein